MYTNKIGNMYLSAIFEEVDSIVKKIVSTNTTLNNRKPTGEISIPIKEKLDSMFDDIDYVYTYENFFGSSSSTRSVIDKDLIVKFTIATDILLNTLSNLATDITNSKLFGVIIVSGETRLNPFHPIVANEIVKNYDYYIQLLGDQVEIIIYRYKDAQTIKESRLKESLDIISDSVSIINTQSYNATTGYHISSYTAKDAVFNLINTNYKNLGHIDLTPLGNNKDISSVITPVQFLVYGIVFPYYGIIASRKYDNNGDYESIDLSFFRSGNINSSDNMDYVEYVNTCTGEQSNKLYESLMTLNYMNGNSSYYQEIIGVGYAEFAQASIYFSAELYRQFLNSNHNQSKQGEQDAA